MKVLGNFIGLVAIVVAASVQPAAAAETHALDPATMQAAVAAPGNQADAERATLNRLLERPDVQEIARTAGLDLQRAHAAIATLQGDELTQLAARAHSADLQLSGGSTVVITSTVLLLGLIIILLLA